MDNAVFVDIICVFHLILVISVHCGTETDDILCPETSPRSCNFICRDTPQSNGDLEIDLSSLKSSEARFKNIPDAAHRPGFNYSWNPCSKFNVQGSDSCNGVFACQNTLLPLKYALGSKRQVIYSRTENKVIMSYSGGTAGRSLTVTLVYKAGEFGHVPNVTQLGAGSSMAYRSTLYTKYAPHGDDNDDESDGISIGTILCITFLVVVVLYFGIGIAYKHRQGARGKEKIPNYNFWRKLPGLTKDGCLFSASKTKECISNARERRSPGQNGEGYDPIKD